MIKGNTVYLGYGDVAVNATITDKIEFINIKPPYTIGESLIGVEGIEYLESIEEKLSYNDCREILEQLKEITEENNIIKIKEITVNFSNFNQKSVDVVIRAVKHIMRNYIKLMAC